MERGREGMLTEADLRKSQEILLQDEVTPLGATSEACVSHNGPQYTKWY